MRKLMFLISLSVLFLSCKSSNNTNLGNTSNDTVPSYDLRNNTICCDRSYEILKKENEEKIYFILEI